MQYVKISDNDAADEPEREVLYTALHHAREPNSASQMIFFMWYLLENYPSKPDIKALVDNLEMYFVPCVNPDGYIYNETNQPNGGGFWRKNRRNNGDGTFGVDLNRNYGYFWGDLGGSSGETSSEIYRGPDAFSEPETQSIRDFCLAHEFLFTLNYHTSGNLLIYPWAYSDSPADNAFVEYGKLFTRENKYHYGTTTETVGYSVNGSSDDWMYAEAGTYSFTPEVGTTGFWPVFNDIDKYNKDNMWQNLSMAYSALRYAEAKDLSDVQLTQTTGALVIELSRYGLLDGPITVTLTPISPNVTSNASSHVFTSIGHLETQQTSLSYTLDQQVEVGDEVVFLLETDNGFWVHADTLKKRFQSGLAGPTVTLVSDALDATDNWVGDWLLTEDIYNSPTSCMTDSPFGENYQTSTSTYTQLVTPITIPANATDANLRFAARWDIEEDWDYVVVSAVELQQGGVTQPLCGLFTEPGNSNQLLETPIYDGVQSDWVAECMSLKDFIGKTFIIRFQLVSDGFLEQDGFFFDDFKVDYNLPLSNTQHVAFNGIRLWQNEPNPAPEQTVIRWNLENQTSTESLQLVMWDALGRIVFEKSIPAGDGSFKLDTRSMAQGVYHYAVKTNQGQSIPLKMTVIR
ncbi:MAG: immune inhibitor A [Saprospiraceae bacterium]|nr:immune inhibitor A [Saprospiraceae bacterium]